MDRYSYVSFACSPPRGHLSHTMRRLFAYQVKRKCACPFGNVGGVKWLRAGGQLHRHALHLQEGNRDGRLDCEIDVLGQVFRDMRKLQGIKLRDNDTNDAARCVEQWPTAVPWLYRR